MIGMREKLIELLRHEKRCPEILEICGEDCPYFDISKASCCDEDTATADMLIANGVTIPVRCKDCKYYDEKDEDCNHPGLWAEYASDFGLGMYPDDFCSRGERRTDENND